jgi:hypothetical protein
MVNSHFFLFKDIINDGFFPKPAFKSKKGDVKMIQEA